MGKENTGKALPAKNAGVRKTTHKTKQGSPAAKAAKSSAAASSGSGGGGRIDAAKYVVSSVMGYPADGFHDASDSERRVWGCYASLEAATPDAWHVLYTQNDLCMEEDEVKRAVKVTRSGGRLQLALEPPDSEWFTVFVEPVKGCR